ncbi:type II secretion system major pseudopilin GspG [Vandammella animalimorsus]|uniref:Type II secretion system core protein G n=1 Tax=Vandammella animalimorsus TaxID=2029117 RepID=A0A2A2AZF3_9BURK|nr:type II secretion system major pseudopilin GspG [Vandammella animalimorsus]PAT35443.1 type II secretion system protein GspG [Vandammella animalimorsus]PAT36547.1 type II secretion system protein GspG [Vandammella animalimorsus]PAT43955.1 type II secretion system protein GspG [Vandammella animalimorsus]
MSAPSTPQRLRGALTRSLRSAQRGFTLIEILVIVAILALLASLVGPQVMGVLGGQKSKTALVQIAEIEKALDVFKLEVGRYPTSSEGLQALVTRPGGVAIWNGPYLRGGVPSDPWGKPYVYSNPGPNGGVQIMSYGGDGAPGGEGENADISNAK